MNIEIANRLVNLRKSNHLSQEALAEKLGISRQAVSKWERAEASPDTDNLILLAKLYKVSLDELLKTDEIQEWEAEVQTEETAEEETTDTKDDTASTGYEEYDEKEGDYVHIGFDGIHVQDKNGKVHVGWKGIHVEDKKDGTVKVDKDGVFVNGEEVDVSGHIFRNKEHIRKAAIFTFPMDFLISCIYIFLGISTGELHPYWLLLFLIPLWHSLVEAILHKNASHFAYPILVVMIFLYVGFMKGMWHPGWVLFLTIPVYYGMIDWVKAVFHK
ncbi:MAG: helix-turn-helix domain-containing protein [Roseburia sp.]|nr:helix-turn-helix domain-containing protein [Roseburia sp.]MCM1279975.1 helix-turn-helix domain-containing protein [Robinsoniella sp.]